MDLENIQFKHRVPIQIRFNDVDALGHVNNAVQSSYYDVGRIHYFQDIENTKLNWKDPRLVVVHVELNFMHSIRMHDEIWVESKIYQFGNKSLRMIQRIIDKNNQVKSTCNSILSGYDIVNDTSLPISEAMKQAVNNYEL